MSSASGRDQKATPPDRSPLASALSSQKARDVSQSLCPLRIAMQLASGRLQSRTVRSLPADPSIFPSGEKDMAETTPLCPSRTAISFFEARSQRRMVRSWEALARISPFGEKDRAVIG